MLRNVTKSVELSCPVEQAFAFLAHVPAWAQWATYSVRQARRCEDGSWSIKSYRGNTRLTMRAEAAHGILDHDYQDSDGNAWTIPARVVATPTGCMLMMTLCQPAAVPDATFTQMVSHAEAQFATLRELVARARQMGRVLRP